MPRSTLFWVVATFNLAKHVHAYPTIYHYIWFFNSDLKLYDYTHFQLTRKICSWGSFYWHSKGSMSFFENLQGSEQKLGQINEDSHYHI